MSQNCPPPPPYNLKGTTGYPSAAPGYPQGASGYPSGPPAPGYPSGPPGYPSGTPGYPSRPPGYPSTVPGHPRHPTPSVYVIDGPRAPSFGRYSVFTTCPSCHRQINTVVDRQSGCGAGLLAALLCCIGCWPLAWVPCVISDLQDNYHYCPNCQALVGEDRAFI